MHAAIVHFIKLCAFRSNAMLGSSDERTADVVIVGEGTFHGNKLFGQYFHDVIDL